MAGRWRGRIIRAPAGDQVRPTADRVREAWMSIVHASLPHARVLDLFAGSGALGLEAISRGAKSVDFVESDARSLLALRHNAVALGAGEAARVHRADVFRFLERIAPGTYDVAFADPPYRRGLAAGVADRWLASPFAAVLGIEHEAGEVMPAGGRVRRYGDTALTFYSLGNCEVGSGQL